MLGTLKQVASWRPGGYLRASWWMFSWLALRALAQAALVVLLARTLGPKGYGAYVALVATAGFFTPLAGMGAQAVVLRDGSRHPERIASLLATARRLWLRGALGFGLLGCVVAFVSLRARLGGSWLLVAAAAPMIMAEVASSSLTEIVAREAQARHRVHAYGAVQTGLILVRLGALLTLLLLPVHGLASWLLLYAAASLLYTAALVMRLPPEARSANGRRPALTELAREGLPFAVGALSFRLQMEFNKPVLATLGFEAVGIFGAAQRVVDLAGIPLIALQDALWPRLFSRGAPGRLLLRTGAPVALLALLGGLMLFFLAPWVPRLLGPGFAGSVGLLRMLAWLPLLQLLRNMGNAYLVASGRSSSMTSVYVLSALFGMAASALLILRSGLQGAVLATYASEIFMIALQFALHRLTRKPAA